MARKALEDGRQEIIGPERRTILVHNVTRYNQSLEVGVGQKPLDIVKSDDSAKASRMMSRAITSFARSGLAER